MGRAMKHSMMRHLDRTGHRKPRGGCKAPTGEVTNHKQGETERERERERGRSYPKLERVENSRGW